MSEDERSSEPAGVEAGGLGSSWQRAMERSEQVGRILREAGWTLALAESCTGGLVAHFVTEIPGSSKYFILGAVTYANRAKERLLAVSGEDLARFGAVSRKVAEAMARGVRDLAAADCVVGITGIAGPGGGTKRKPVGTVYLAALGPWGLLERREVFSGSRSEIKVQAAAVALDMLVEACQKGGGRARKA